jgi:acetyl-CoA acetyltransferase family protein
VSDAVREAFICDAVRTPIGRFGGALAQMRADDLAAIPIRALMARHPRADWDRLEDVVLGCANQAGEDNRNVARMAALLAGLPDRVPGATVNRLCGSGLDAVGTAARAIRSGEVEFVIAGGVESMTRAPFVLAKSAEPFQRAAEIYDTTLGWRFVNPALAALHYPYSMGETAENVAERWGVSRERQDAFALDSQQRAVAAIEAGRFDDQLVPVHVAGRKGETTVVDRDEHPRADSSL